MATRVPYRAPIICCGDLQTLLVLNRVYEYYCERGLFIYTGACVHKRSLVVLLYQYKLKRCYVHICVHETVCVPVYDNYLWIVVAA